MPETYPDDNTLLGLTQDDATGVEYIPTGQSPYVMAYRRMLYRLLRASERANDLRVFEVGGRSIGVKAGRCFVGALPRDLAEAGPIELDADATTYVYVDEAGAVTTSTTGLPADRATFIPLAEVFTDADSITGMTDLRGEAILQAQSAALAGITATASEINQALDGIEGDVTAAALSALTGGFDSTVDSLHRHLATTQDIDGTATVKIANASTDASANIGLLLSLPAVMPDSTQLDVDRDNGFFRQSYLGTYYHLVGVTGVQWAHTGTFSSSITGQLAGVVPVAGEVVALILSCRLNTQSSDSADGLSIAGYVNGNALTGAAGSLTSNDGSGFRSTDQGDGTAATIVSSGTEQVGRGDLISFDLTYTANGTVSQQPTDVGVIAVIKAGQPA